MRKALIIGILTVVSMCHTAPAVACACVGFVSFDQSADAAPIVIAGEIVAVSGPDDQAAFFRDLHVSRFIDVRVVRVVKGKRQPVTVRVWDESFGSDCEGVFADLAPGGDVVLAVWDAGRVAAKYPDEPYLRSLGGIRPAPGDLVAQAACADVIKVLKTPRDRKRYFGRGK